MSEPVSIDRVTPTLEPDSPAVMLQEWRHLLFLHWEIAYDDLRTLVPRRLEIDRFEGKCYVGVVPFTLPALRAGIGPEIPGLSPFHEVNVRTYVHLNGREPGVWFFSLDASSLFAVTGARIGYTLPYYHAAIDFSDEESWIRFESRREKATAECHFRYRPTGDERQAAPGTLDHFLIERYVLYAGADERLIRARVHHSPYPLRDAELDVMNETLVLASGLNRSPDKPLVHYSAGVDVKVYAPSFL